MDFPYFRAISYWYADREEEALAAMPSFRTRSPNDDRAFPEEMESAYAERRRSQKVDDRRVTGLDGETPLAVTSTDVVDRRAGPHGSLPMLPMKGASRRRCE